jgi:hypothetical protein
MEKSTEAIRVIPLAAPAILNQDDRRYSGIASSSAALKWDLNLAVNFTK